MSIFFCTFAPDFEYCAFFHLTHKIIMTQKHFSFLCALACTICGLMVATSLFAVPAKRGWQTKTQPDGTAIEVQLMGDEFYHYWTTRDGKIAREQEDGTFLLTNEARPTGKQFKARRAASPMHISKARKAIGERNFAPKGLVILVQFKDVSFQSENNNAAFDDMMNKAGYDYNGASGSAVDYFKAQSNNAYAPQFDIFGPVTLPNNMKYYGEEGELNGETEHDLYIADFVIDAVKAADDAGCDFSQYDSDNDGYVDIVYLFYAGMGQADGGSSNTIWPHNWELESALYYEQTHGGTGYYVNTNAQGYITSENLPKYDGKTINNYVCSGELNGDGNRSGIGTLCHEFSHVIGLPDYYDTGDGDNDDLTPNDWSLMDYGSYLNDGMTPPNYSIYDKYFMGWATPKFLAKDEQKNVTLTTGYSDAYQITGGTSLVDYTNTGTVYYIENRQNSGWDEHLPGHGMLVWKVMYNATAWENNEPNATAGTVRYTLVCAGGGTNIGDIYRNSSWVHHGNVDPFPGNSVVRQITPKTGCAITEIQETGNNITFKYNGGFTKTECDYEIGNYGHCTAPSDGQVNTGTALSLTITPESGYTLADANCWAVAMGLTDLVYGTDFTYNASTGEFRIENVTDDVTIIVEGKQLFTIVWWAKDAQYTTTQTAGTITLPDGTPAGCGDGRTFVGWCKTEYEDDAIAPEYIKNGDVATAGDKYYAVFAKESAGESTWNLVTNASTLKAGDVLVIASNSKGKTAGDISSSIMSVKESTFSSGDSYATITSLGSGTVELTLGGSEGAWTLTSSSGLLGATAAKSLAWGSGTTTWSISISGGDATIQNGTNSYGRFLHNTSSPRFTTYASSTATSNTMLLPQLYRKTGGTTYSEFTTSCAACEKSVTIVKGTETNGTFTINKTGAQETCGAAVVVTVSNISAAAGYQFKQITQSGIDEGVTINQNNRTVTYAKNTTGTSTITVEFEEKPKYEVKFHDRGTVISTQQVTKGTTANIPDREAVCDGFTFVGWWTAELEADNTTEKTWVTDFTINVAKDFYAIYSHTEQGQGPTTFDETQTGVYKIYADVGGTKYYATTLNSSNKLQSTTNEANAVEFTFEKLTDGWAINIGTTYLKYANNSNSKTDLGTQSSTYKWTIGSGIKGTWRISASTGSNRVLAFRAGSSNNIFAGYSTSNITTNGTEYYDVELLGSGANATTYYSSTVDCSVIPTGCEEIVNDAPAAIKVLRDGQIVIIRGEAVYSITGARLK